MLKCSVVSETTSGMSAMANLYSGLGMTALRMLSAGLWRGYNKKIALR